MLKIITRKGMKKCGKLRYKICAFVEGGKLYKTLCMKKVKARFIELISSV